MNAAQAQLNAYIMQQRTEGQRATALDVLWRSLPFWLAAAFFLISELPLKDRQERRRRTFPLQIALFAFGLALVSMGIAVAGWLIATATFIRGVERFGIVNSAGWLTALALLGVAVFWFFPAGLSWIHDDSHRPIAFVSFYAIAFALGLALARFRGAKSWQEQTTDILWTVGVAVWLLGYFGPLGYSLTRHGSLIVLTVIATGAIIMAGGFRQFFSMPALFLPGLLPLIFYDVESFNLKYPLLDRIPELSAGGRVALSGFAAILFVVALHYPRARNGHLRFFTATLISLLLILVWLALGSIFFQFNISRLVGGLLACVWFAGCLELFRRAQLPLRWFALVSAVFLFVLLTFFLNGFALSHVDFRFAANKIVPAAKEIWRAPQLIFWATVKYAFALLPPLAILRASVAGQRVWSELLLLGWWRELTLVASALGLAVFNDRGMRDLCSEEIYFWTFLNLVFFAACLIMSSKPAALKPIESGSGASESCCEGVLAT